MNTMPEIASVNDPPIAKRGATVSASALAQHLDCSRTYVGKLEGEGVIQRQGDGFPLDQCRVAYLRYLRRGRRQSPRIEADAAHVALKTEMLQLRLMEKRRPLAASRHDRRDARDKRGPSRVQRGTRIIELLVSFDSEARSVRAAKFGELRNRDAGTFRRCHDPLRPGVRCEQ